MPVLILQSIDTKHFSKKSTKESDKFQLDWIVNHLFLRLTGNVVILHSIVKHKILKSTVDESWGGKPIVL